MKLRSIFALSDIPDNVATTKWTPVFSSKYGNKSFIELTIAFELKTLFIVKFKTEDTKIPKPLKFLQRKKNRNLDVDMILPAIGKKGVVIEYDGHPWHKKKLIQDTQKNQILNAAGYPVIRIREDLPLTSSNDIWIAKQHTSPKQILNKLLKKLDKLFNLPVDINDYLAEPYCLNGIALQQFLQKNRNIIGYVVPKSKKIISYYKPPSSFVKIDETTTKKMIPPPELDIPNVNVSFILDPPPDPPGRFLKGETCLVCWGEDKRLCLCGPPIDDAFFEDMENLINEMDLSGQVEIRKRLVGHEN